MTTRLRVVFDREHGCSEPVRACAGMCRDERRKLGTDIKTVEVGWPKGPPLVNSLKDGLWEIRTSCVRGEARVFCAIEDGSLVLLHAIIKKTRATPTSDLELARKRLKKYTEAT
jgi:phage-related protein